MLQVWNFLYAPLILLLSGSLFAAENAPQRFNVRAFGAVGDGIADDQPALIRAAKAVAQNKGGVLYLPSGVYRCGRQAGMQNGIEFAGVSDVTILFDPGAVLLMDNLNPQNDQGDHGHGIVIRGPCKNIAVINAAVKWAKKPSARTMGDAFRFEGFPFRRPLHLQHPSASVQRRVQSADRRGPDGLLRY